MRDMERSELLFPSEVGGYRSGFIGESVVAPRRLSVRRPIRALTDLAHSGHCG
jgi:hypothetical protein